MIYWLTNLVFSTEFHWFDRPKNETLPRMNPNLLIVKCIYICYLLQLVKKIINALILVLGKP